MPGQINKNDADTIIVKSGFNNKGPDDIIELLNKEPYSDYVGVESLKTIIGNSKRATEISQAVHPLVNTINETATISLAKVIEHNEIETKGGGLTRRRRVLRRGKKSGGKSRRYRK